MKNFTSLFLTLLLLLSVSISSSQAQSCNSAASVVSDIFNKVHDLVVANGCVTGSDAAATRTRNNYGQNYFVCFNTASQINELQNQLVLFWNSKVNNSWATIGPRRLDLNQNHTGTLVSTGGRKFVSLPILDKNSITVTIDETSGKGKASVVVCKVNQNNQYTKVATKWFNDSKQKKMNKSEKQTVTVNGAKNHIIVVHLDGKSVANTFGYKLKAQ